MASLRNRLPSSIPTAAERAREEVRVRMEARRFSKLRDEPLGYPHPWAIYSIDHQATQRPAWLAAAVPLVSKVAILPGETFSLRRLVGPKTRRSRIGRRLSLAPETQRDANTLATLVYNLALRAGLHPVERHAHAHDLHGANRDFPLGLDAVLGPGQDLRIFNSSHTTAVLVLGLDEFTVYGELRGMEALDCDVTIAVERVESLLDRDRIVRDPLQNPAIERVEQQGAPGARVTVVRTRQRAGFPPMREEFVTTYAPVRALIRRGPRPAPTSE